MVEPPGRLLVYDPADWLPLVDPCGYDPDAHRARVNCEPYGEPCMTAEDWRAHTARVLWSRARLDWCEQHGWPGGWTVLDLLRQSVQVRRAQSRGVP